MKPIKSGFTPFVEVCTIKEREKGGRGRVKRKFYNYSFPQPLYLEVCTKEKKGERRERGKEWKRKNL